MARAGLASAHRRAEELAEGLGRLKRDNEASQWFLTPVDFIAHRYHSSCRAQTGVTLLFVGRDRARLLRESLAARRRTLSAARLLSEPPLDGPLAQETQALHTLSNALARARGGLVQELVEVFSVVEVGGRPALGARAGARGEWTVGGLVLPVPGDIRRLSSLLSCVQSNIAINPGYPLEHINAVLTSTIHFLGLLAFYLGVKLPFEIVWSGGRFGVGQPWIRAGRGGESGSWAKSVVFCSFLHDVDINLNRWTFKHPLHLSPSGSTRAPSPTSPTSSPSSTLQLPTPVCSTLSASTASLAPSISQNQASFTTAFAMLLYNVCYLAYTQGVEIPLSQAGDALSNLWAMCCSGELGR